MDACLIEMVINFLTSLQVNLQEYVKVSQQYLVVLSTVFFPLILQCFPIRSVLLQSFSTLNLGLSESEKRQSYLLTYSSWLKWTSTLKLFFDLDFPLSLIPPVDSRMNTYSADLFRLSSQRDPARCL